MQTVRSQLFEGITNEECARMFQCFGAREAGYEAGALISEFDGEQNAVGVLLSGSADLVRLDADGNLGRTGLVLTPIRPGCEGRVRVDGLDWQARAGVPLAKGTRCQVTAVDGAVLIVVPVTADAAAV